MEHIIGMELHGSIVLIQVVGIIEHWLDIMAL
nr:MAG TPA: hypothetical protein [Caudoviricetes sp.]